MIKYHANLVQGTDEWFAARCGLLTASEMKFVVTPTLKVADNDKTRAHLYELLAQRVNNYVEPSYVSDDMMRGRNDEFDAKITYTEHYEQVQDMGFVTNDKWGFTLGYSPDGLVGEDGQIESKSRRQKFQTETIINGVLPDEYKIQVQTGLLVTERKWCDFISYCGGMPMFTIRVEPDKIIQDAVITAATSFHEKMDEMLSVYTNRLTDKTFRLVPTERKIEQEITI